MLGDDPAAGPGREPATPAVIDLRGVARTYPGPPPVQALRPVDLRVEPGEYVAVVGPSGSGKSTLLNLLGLLDRPSEGRYLLDGIDTADLNERERTAMRGYRIGFVFQSFHLMAYRTATENVMLAQVYTGASRKDRMLAAREVLCRVGLGHRLDALPSVLSGGERQRVAIARALVGAPSLLLCDEPTGNLDTATSQAIGDLLQELNTQGTTLVVITHDPNAAARAGRIVAIRDGLLDAGSGSAKEPAHA